MRIVALCNVSFSGTRVYARIESARCDLTVEFCEPLDPFSIRTDIIIIIIIFFFIIVDIDIFINRCLNSIYFRDLIDNTYYGERKQVIAK